MPSTYSPNLRIELIANGEQANTWGTTTNNNLGTLIGEAIAGLVDIDVSASDVTLTALDGLTDQARQMMITVSGTPGTVRSVFCPDGDTKVYVVANDADDVVTFSTVSGYGVDIPVGTSKFLYCDGVDVYEAVTAIDTLLLGGAPTTSLEAANKGYVDSAVAALNTFTASRAIVSNGSGNLAASSVTSTEVGYLSGVTSAIQTQLNAKQATITGAATTITSSNLTASRAVTSDASGKVAVSATTSTELGYVSGVTSAIQTQLNAKQATITGAATTITSSNLTASRAVVSDASGKVAVSSVTSTEVGYLSGVTSAIQTQLNGKQAAGSYAPATSGTAILKGNGSGGFSNATSGTDYAPPTSGSSILYGNGSGGFSNVSIGTGLSFSAGTLSSTVTTPIPSGTRMLFAQASAPVGWTQVTTYNNYALRVVSGTGGGTGGSVGFTSAFASQAVAGSVSVSGSVGSTTLSTAQLASHYHVIPRPYDQYIADLGSGGNLTNTAPAAGPWQSNASFPGSTNNTGSDNSHNHSFSGSGSFTGTAINLAVQYVDTIICSKD